jgi:DNA-binding MarR family transcriptional regulator
MTFSRSVSGKVFEVDLRESAQQLREHLPELDLGVFEAFLLMGRAWEAARRIGGKAKAGLGLTHYQFQTLRFLLLAESSRLTIGELASRHGISSVNCTKLVNRMQKAGMVRRELDSRDRRVVWVVLTEAGRQRYVACLPISNVDRAVFGVLSTEEQETLIDLLSRIAEKAVLLEQASASNDYPASASSNHGTKLNLQESAV